MILLYLILPLLALLFYAAGLTDKSKEKFYFWLFAIFLIIIAGLREPGTDKDSLNYFDLVENADRLPIYFRNFLAYVYWEPFYYFPASVIRTYSLPTALFFIFYACMSVGVKFYAIQRMTPFPFLSSFVLVCHFFYLQDMTQIRTAVAVGFMLCAILALVNRNYISFILLICIGGLFHYSLLILFFLAFLDTHTLNRYIYFGLLVIPYLLIFAGFNIVDLLSLANLGVFTEKLQIYNDLVQAGVWNYINLFSVELIIQISLCSLFILKWDVLQARNRFSVILIKAYVISVFLLVIFSPIPTFSFRFGGLLEGVHIILIPFLLYIIKPKALSYLIIFSVSSVLFYIAIFYAKFVEPYSLFTEGISFHAISGP